MSKRKCLCGYESRIDNVKNHMKKCKAYPIIKVFKEQLEKLQDKVDYLQKRNEEVEKKSDPKILEKLNEVTKKNTELESEIENLKLELRKVKEEDTEGCIYIVKLREFVTRNENVYKIGRCKCIEQRLKNYPKGSMLIHYEKVEDQYKSEKLLKEAFKKWFKQRTDLGSEYFNHSNKASQY